MDRCCCVYLQPLSNCYCKFVVLDLLRTHNAEERFLERKFGEDYLIWASSLPAFFPNLKLYKSSIIPFSFKSVLRREYSGVLATVIGFVFVELIRGYFSNGEWFISQSYLYLLFIVSFIALFLRTLKHHTELLSEEGRS